MTASTSITALTIKLETLNAQLQAADPRALDTKSIRRKIRKTKEALADARRDAELQVVREEKAETVQATVAAVIAADHTIEMETWMVEAAGDSIVSTVKDSIYRMRNLADRLEGQIEAGRLEDVANELMSSLPSILGNASFAALARHMTEMAVRRARLEALLAVAKTNEG